MHPYFDLIPKYFPELSEKQIGQFGQLWDFYHDWNAKINVISRKDIDELYLRHVLYSLSIARIFKLKEGSEVLDVGTGGGFPGIPLSIYFDSVSFTLVDSIGKKIKVIHEVIRTLGLENVTAMQSRVEELKNSYDIAVSRAVAKLPVFISWVFAKIRSGDSSGVGNGIIYIKGGDVDEELQLINWKIKVFEVSALFEEEYFKTKKVIHIIKP